MRCASSISIVLLFVTINAVGNASAPSDDPAVDVDVVQHGKADALRVVISRIRALVEDDADAIDS